jgi:uridylate kinase
MDLTAISMCMDAQLPIHVFNIRKRGNIRRVLEGESVGSVVKG